MRRPLDLGHDNQRGFTLLELLVVLMLVAMVVAIIPGFMIRSQPRLEVQIAARAIADGLRETRSHAILRNRQEVFAVDVDHHLFRAGQSAPVRIDRDIVLSFRGARSQLIDEGVGSIRYFPDGSSTGGLVGLSQDEAHVEVRSDWLTGLVTIDAAAP
ncbi:MAG: GspH/FimT family pseudopilin [Pseudomonadota bacterium]